MTAYNYDQDDFKAASQVNLTQLQDEISNSSISTANISYINMDENAPNFSVSIVFDGTLSGGDETTLTNIVNAYSYAEYKDACIIKDVKTAGTNGGTFTADAWQTRTLNTIDGLVNFLTLSSNQFTLDAGTYTILVRAPACDVQNHQSRLKNITDNTEIMGMNSFSSNGNMTVSDIYTILTLTTQKTYEVQHICSKSSSGIGFGRATGFNSEEVYTTINIQKMI